MLLVVFGIKAAMVPLHFWLPDSYPNAPGPVAALFAGLLTKVGFYALLRTQTLLFPRDEPWTLLLVLAVATMLVGALGALAQNDLNRLLSFLLVSHIGFMLFGLAVFDAASVSGAALYAAHHITVLATLFLVSGLITRRTGTVALDQMGGLLKSAPGLAVLFAIPALTLAGIPPTAGSSPKLALLQAGAAAGPSPTVGRPGIVIVASLLTLYALVRVWVRVFWGEPKARAARRRPGRRGGRRHRRARRSRCTSPPAGWSLVEPGHRGVRRAALGHHQPRRGGPARPRAVPDRRAGCGGGPAMTVVRRWPAVVGLALVWVLLWGTFTPLIDRSAGCSWAPGSPRCSRCRSAGERLPFRPLRVLALVAYLLRDLGCLGRRGGLADAAPRHARPVRRDRRGAAAHHVGPHRRRDGQRAVALARHDGAADRPRARPLVRLLARAARPCRGRPAPGAGSWTCSGSCSAAFGTPEEIAAAERRMRELAR